MSDPINGGHGFLGQASALAVAVAPNGIPGSILQRSGVLNRIPKDVHIQTMPNPTCLDPTDDIAQEPQTRYPAQETQFHPERSTQRDAAAVFRVACSIRRSILLMLGGVLEM